jgi:hypothetical protein
MIDIHVAVIVGVQNAHRQDPWQACMPVTAPVAIFGNRIAEIDESAGEWRDAARGKRSDQSRRELFT